MEKNILPTVFVMVIGRNSAGSFTALDLESKVMNAAAQLTGTSLLIQIERERYQKQEDSTSVGDDRTPANVSPFFTARDLWIVLSNL